MFGWAQIGLRLIGPPVRIIFYIEHNINVKFNIAAASLAVWFNPIWGWESAGHRAAGPWAITQIIEFETFIFIEGGKKKIKDDKNALTASQSMAVRGRIDSNAVSCAAEVH